MSLLEPAHPVDSGRIYSKFSVPLDKSDVADDISAKLEVLTVRCLDLAVSESLPEPVEQVGDPGWLRRRTREDSRLDPDQTIRDQFDILRVSDPVRYPAFFELHGQRFELILRKAGSHHGG